MSDPITIPDLAAWMQKHILNTFDVFEQWREKGNTEMQQWCRGRIDAWFQIMEIIDKERLSMLRAEWTRVVGGDAPEGDEYDT